MPVLVHRPYVRVAADRTPSQPDLCLDFEWWRSEKIDKAPVVYEFEVRELAYGSFVTDTRLAGYRVGIYCRYIVSDTEARQGAEYQRRRHEQSCSEDLSEMFGFIVWCCAEDLIFTVECLGFGMTEAPVAEFMGSCVALYSNGALCGDEHAADSFGNKGSKQAT
ncbi:MAG: hypothetical protein OXK16_06735 [bacterium]|nr:hypothetical protein [bacterium]